MRRVVLVVPAAVALLLALVTGARANTSHDGWPKIDGVLLMNKTDSSRPLDARPGTTRSAAATVATRATRSTSAASATGASSAAAASAAG